MRLQLTIPKELEKNLRQLAILEHRYPRQQAEVLLYQAIQRAMVAHATTLPHDTARSAEWDATGRGQLAKGPLQPLQAQEEFNQTDDVLGEVVEKAYV
jgi:hypothetical protein